MPLAQCHILTQKTETNARMPILLHCTLALPSVCSSQTVALTMCMPAPAFCPTFAYRFTGTYADQSAILCRASIRVGDVLSLCTTSSYTLMPRPEMSQCAVQSFEQASGFRQLNTDRQRSEAHVHFKYLTCEACKVQE